MHIQPATSSDSTTKAAAAGSPSPNKVVTMAMRANQKMVTQIELVEIEMHNRKCKQLRRELVLAEKARNVVRENLIRRLEEGAEIEAGSHTASIQRSVRLMTS